MIFYNKTGEIARIFSDTRNPRKDNINLGKLCINNMTDLKQYDECLDYNHQYDRTKDEQLLISNYDVMYFFDIYYDINTNIFSYIDAESLNSDPIGYYIITRDAAQAYCKTYRIYIFR